MSKSSNILLVTLIVFFLLVLSLTVTSIFHYGGYRQRGPHDAVLSSVVHQFGWVGFLLLAVSTSYSLLKRVAPRDVKMWLLIHCILGVASMAFTWLHAIGGLWPVRPRDFLSFFALFLMTVVVVSGILERFVKIKFVKSYWRDVHIPLTVLLYIVLTIHILEKLALLW